MNLLPLLIAAAATAQLRGAAPAPRARVPSVPVVSLSVAALSTSFTPSLTPTYSPSPALALSAPSDAPVPTALPSAGFVADREAGLVAKLAAKLPGQDSTSRTKTTAWIRDIALENPRAAVQSAAVNALADDAVAARNLVHFENVAADIEAIATATSFDHVFEDAVARLVEAARNSGRAQRHTALTVAERIGSGASAERRERAAALIESLKADASFRLEAAELDRTAARVRAGR